MFLSFSYRLEVQVSRSLSQEKNDIQQLSQHTHINFLHRFLTLTFRVGFIHHRIIHGDRRLRSTKDLLEAALLVNCYIYLQTQKPQLRSLSFSPALLPSKLKYCTTNTSLLIQFLSTESQSFVQNYRSRQFTVSEIFSNFPLLIVLIQKFLGRDSRSQEFVPNLFLKPHLIPPQLPVIQIELSSQNNKMLSSQSSLWLEYL